MIIPKENLNSNLETLKEDYGITPNKDSELIPFNESIDPEKEQKELSEKERELMVQFSYGIYKHRIKDVNDYIKKYNITLEEVLDEIDKKISKLSSMNRSFLVSYTIDLHKQWLELYNKLYEASRSKREISSN